MEKKLQEYRALRKRNQLVDKTKNTLKKFIMWESKSSTSENVADTKIDVKEAEPLLDDVETNSEHSSCESAEEEPARNTTVEYVLYTLYFIFWVTVYLLFIKFGFGTVYLILSALFGIYWNTRTGPKVAGEISAYSVFNKNCEAIDGALNAEQFEREIRYGSGSVR